MITHEMKLVTIVTESVLEHTLEADIERLGGRGYTITNARGKGQRGVRDAGWATDSNIRIEVLCEPKVADAILEYFNENYYDNYAMLIFLSDVQVLRAKKFA